MTKSLVLIDDEIEFLEVFKQMLESQLSDWNIQTFHESELAIIQLKEFDVIVTDYRMPKFNGKDIIEAALDLNKKHIYLISGEYPDELKCLFENKISYFSKPITRFQIQKIVEEINNFSFE